MNSSDSTPPVTISLIVPMHSVEGYLPQFLASLAAQEPGEYAAELIFIDDGSPDQSGEIATRWLSEQGRFSGEVIRQKNQGVSVARMVGLTRATGDWVSFPDPDDALGAGYLTSIASFIRAHGHDVDAVSPNILRIDENMKRVRDTHPLRRRFAPGTRIVDVEQEPDAILMSVATGFFPRQALLDSEATFVQGLHASEDALFVIDYYTSLGYAPRLGLVTEAQYLYRRRAAGTSAVDTYSQRADTYIDRFRDQYLPRLRAFDPHPVPRWLQYVLLYEFRWLFQEQISRSGYAEILTDAQREEALSAATECLSHVDLRSIDEFRATALSIETRALLRALKGANADPHTYVTARRNGFASLTRYFGPSDSHSDSGHDYFPDYFGQRALRKHTTWVDGSAVPHGAVRVPAYARLTSWERPPRIPAKTLWTLNEMRRRARASWLSKATIVRLREMIRPRRPYGRLHILVDAPSEETPASASLLEEIRAHAEQSGYIVSRADLRPRGTLPPRDGNTIRLLQRADVILSTAGRAEWVELARIQARAGRPLHVAVLDQTLSRVALASFEASQVDLVIAPDQTFADALFRDEDRHGYSRQLVLVADNGSQALDTILRFTR